MNLLSIRQISKQRHSWRIVLCRDLETFAHGLLDSFPNSTDRSSSSATKFLIQSVLSQFWSMDAPLFSSITIFYSIISSKSHRYLPPTRLGKKERQREGTKGNHLEGPVKH